MYKYKPFKGLQRTIEYIVRNFVVTENLCIVIHLLSGCREPLYNVYVVRNLLSMAAENLCIVRNILCGYSEPL